MNKRINAILILWISVLILSFVISLQSARNHRNDIVFQTARTMFDQVVITRQWNALHNGVYVKITDTTQPNAYLADASRDLECANGLRLTKINPSYMTRQISELTDKKRSILFHMTSLNPIRPENAPSDWERNTLNEFIRKNITEKGQFVARDHETIFTYMKPLSVEASCLECHNRQGYKPGDIIGGISVTLLSLPEANFLPIVLAHLLVGGLGCLIILAYGIKLARAYDTIEHQARYDALTHLPNRRYLNERVAHDYNSSLRNGTPFSMIMADIDNFKNYNDTYGHALGDKCLQRVASRIGEVLKRKTDFCARFGGEEFIIVLPETKAEGAAKVAKKILDRVADLNIPHKHSDAACHVTLSLGVVTEATHKNGWESAVKKADEALYLAKKEGKNCFVVYGDSTRPNG